MTDLNPPATYDELAAAEADLPHRVPAYLTAAMREAIKERWQARIQHTNGQDRTLCHEFRELGAGPLPYRRGFESPVSTRNSGEISAHLASGRRMPVFFHSEHRMIPWLREIVPDPVIEINPQTAKDLGIEDGEWVIAENNHGSAKFKAQITPTAHPRIVSVGHGWWIPEAKPEEPGLFDNWEHNCNQLVPMGTQSKSGFGGGAYKTSLCRLVKIKK